MQERPMSSLGRRELLRRGLVAAGAVALGPKLLGLDALSRPDAVALGDTRTIATVVPPPPIITRAGWGANEAWRSSKREFAPLVKAIVHHTAIDEVDPAAQVRGIYRSHTQDNGWADIGYNYLVDSSGRIYEGRWARDYLPGEVHSGEDTTGQLVEGAHASGHNRGCFGIALLGNFANPSTPLTDDAMASLARLIAWKFGPRSIDPHGGSAYTMSNGQTKTFANICGHRDVVPPTSCPGGTLHARLPALRNAVANELSTGLVGYRILGADGSLWNYGASSTFGETADIGDVRRNVGAGVPVRTAAGTPTGHGVWVGDPSGSIYAFGDAPFFGSLGDRRLNKPIVGMAPTPTGGGYWLVASDGGIFTFGDARFFGSTGAIRLNQPIMSMAAVADGAGYWLVARDGGVFTFGSARFLGSAVGRRGFSGRAAAMEPTPTGHGYWILDTAGAVHGFGDAPVFGGGVTAGSQPALALVPVVRP